MDTVKPGCSSWKSPGIEAAALARAPLPVAAVTRTPLWLHMEFSHMIYKILQALEQQVALQNRTRERQRKKVKEDVFQTASLTLASLGKTYTSNVWPQITYVSTQYIMDTLHLEIWFFEGLLGLRRRSYDFYELNNLLWDKLHMWHKPVTQLSMTKWTVLSWVDWTLNSWQWCVSSVL